MPSGGASARPRAPVMSSSSKALGSGKTVLVQGLAAGLGAPDVPTSPTFVLIRHYPGRLELVHADLYRVESRAEVEALGLLELAADGVLAVEWAERAPWLEPGAARVGLEAGASEDDRVVTMTGGGPHLEAAFMAPGP